ncbi:juvenile hormone epoxide hydrolase-like [Leguminivora glycinivorella]|uniref:juvenile hormone epoxide hydrolase-like n=1 Tax=Leguminivora glycinivorella TaxID=1035111 RepID=UPI002010A793|nr:juvenile hormone epoxide hydrolase-like [Leguminivora glycinivorella]
MRLPTCLLLMLGLAWTVGCVKMPSIESPVQGFLKTVNNAIPLFRDIFNSVYENVNVTAFRSALKEAVSMVDAVFPSQPPKDVPERWWGENDPKCEDTCIRPFTVQFSDEMISDLRARIHGRRKLKRTLHGAANSFGTNSEYLGQFLEQWADQYDFRARERWLNSFPQFITNIQGLDIHYIHVKPHNPHNKKVLPILLLHGFPVTAFEYVHVINFLKKDRDDSDFVFEIVAPDLPGYAYSQATSKIGMAPYQMGIIMKNLMLRVGKSQFYIHCGNIGQDVGSTMAVLFPGRVLGIHTNFPFSSRPQTITKLVLGQLYPPSVVEAKNEDKMYPLSAHLKDYMDNFGYFALQASRPDNIGHGLDDSPVTLASWFLGNMAMGTEGPKSVFIDNGNLSAKYDMNDWFDTFTVHWACESMTTAARSYKESQARDKDSILKALELSQSPVPYAAIKFRHEMVYMPDDFLRDKFPNLVHSTTLDFGGHFAGFEEPAVLADSIWTSVAKMELYHENKTSTN